MSTINLDNKTILVTGAAGFIGSNLVKRIYQEAPSATVVGMVITRDSGDTSVLEGSFDKDGLPDNWADFVGRLTDFFQDQSLGILSILVRTTRC